MGNSSTLSKNGAKKKTAFLLVSSNYVVPGVMLPMPSPNGCRSLSPMEKVATLAVETELLSFSLSLTHTHTRAHTLTHSLTHSLTLTLTLTHSHSIYIKL